MLPGMEYPGGKNAPGVYHRIINLMPPHETYIEPFAGSFAIGRLKRPASLNIAIDLDIGSLKMLSRLGLPGAGEHPPPDQALERQAGTDAAIEAPGHARGDR